LDKHIDLNDPKFLEPIHALIRSLDKKATPFAEDLISQQIQTSLRLLVDNHDMGQIKLMTRALKEMRYAFNVFNQYQGKQKISIFGSARTPEEHPNYQRAKRLSEKMGELGWMCMTGAAKGIMLAGLEGAEEHNRFGLAIRLPFEEPLFELFGDDNKHILFRYFFTRKLMFLSQSHAVAAFPGGLGTCDELFEILTLMQTGKNTLIPVVLVEARGGTYWKEWEKFIKETLLAHGTISKEDLSFYKICQGEEEAVEEIKQFYKRYHSSRYVKDHFVIRLKEALTEEQLIFLNQKFSKLLDHGEIAPIETQEEETEYQDLPRISFPHSRKDFGLLRQLIDDINRF
jgi:uncharacterized protein (TIGR00730 family)